MPKKIFIFILFVANALLVTAKDYYPQSQRPDHLLFHLTPAVTLLNYSSIDGRSSPAPSLGFGMEYAHFFHRRLGLSIGAEFNSYAAFYSFDGRKDSLQLFDSWSNRTYKLRQQLYGKEHQSVRYLSIPIKVIFRQKLSQTMNINISGGMVYNIYMSESHSIVSGNIKRQAYFDNIHVNIDDFLPLKLGTFTNYINPSKKPQFSKTLTAVAQIGLTYQLTTRLSLHTDINFQYGSKNIKARTLNILEPSEYAGVTSTNYIGTVKPYAVGFRVGVSYNFDLFNADCHCQSSWWK